MNQSIIEHKGIVSKITDTTIETTITVSTACSGCHAKGSCGMSDNQSRIISVTKSDQNVNIGDQVNIVGSETMGMKAVLFAYVLPFAAVLFTLVLSLYVLNVSEIRAGLYSILILPPYYLILYLFKGKFNKKYTFRIVSE